MKASTLTFLALAATITLFSGCKPPSPEEISAIMDVSESLAASNCEWEIQYSPDEKAACKKGVRFAREAAQQNLDRLLTMSDEQLEALFKAINMRCGEFYSRPSETNKRAACLIGVRQARPLLHLKEQKPDAMLVGKPWQTPAEALLEKAKQDSEARGKAIILGDTLPVTAKRAEPSRASKSTAW